MDEELKFLRALCDEDSPRESRLELIEKLGTQTFSEPEHQVVFDSIRALLSRGLITAERLMIHLTKRGFPDVEIAKYIPRDSA